MMAYLTMMAQRMIELHRVLKPTGSIYLHCDTTAGHYLKLLMDAVFSNAHYRNEITWKRFNFHADAKRFGRITDRILFYTKSSDYVWNRQRVPFKESYIESHFRYADEDGRRYRLDNLNPPGGRGPVYEFHGVTRAWRYSEKNMLKLQAGGRISAVDGTVPQLKRYLDELQGEALNDIWVDIPPINPRAKERLGYPTQKPEALLERIINASSNEGDVVLDPFCGCGTATAAAERLNHSWIGIDITHLAITLVRHRLHDTFGTELHPYEIIGQPTDSGSAVALAEQDRYQFEWGALGLVDARPANDKRRGADAGVDGYINFFDDNSGKPKRIIVQVKSGHVNRGMIATLKGDMEREKAEIGVFITLQPPTSRCARKRCPPGSIPRSTFLTGSILGCKSSPSTISSQATRLPTLAAARRPPSAKPHAVAAARADRIPSSDDVLGV